MNLTLEIIREAAASPQAQDPAAQRRFLVRLPDGSIPVEIPDRPPPGKKAREAAVLIVVFPGETEPQLILTRRTTDVDDHPGQISFPGGSREPDESLRETAIRETKEELGIEADALEVVGELSPVYVMISGFLVYPFVALASRRPVYTPQPKEVEEVLEVPVSLFLDPANVAEEQWTLLGRKLLVPFYRHGENKIWGATARMISMLSEALLRRLELS